MAFPVAEFSKKGYKIRKVFEGKRYGAHPKMEYQVFLCIFQKNSAMATLGLKEMGKLLWEGREKVLPSWLSLPFWGWTPCLFPSKTCCEGSLFESNT